MTNRCVSVVLVCLLAGCASRATSPVANPKVQSGMIANTPASQPIAMTGNEKLSLDEIQPVPVLKPAVSTTQRDGEAPVEAVRFFAQARIAMLDGNRAASIDLLQKAAALDPDSFELHMSLGQLYADDNDLRAQQQWEKSAAIEPDHLELQITLARQLLARAQFSAAVAQLRLARLTSEYRSDDPAAAEADFLLARALQEAGYDRAAIECYERLLSRLDSQRRALARNPQTAALLGHPGVLALYIAALYEKHLDYAKSLGVLRSALAKAPEDFDVDAQIVRDTAASGKKIEALEAATDAVQRFHASRAALALLHEQAGSDAAATNRLISLHKQTPQDRPIVYALIDSYRAGSRDNEAAALLDTALKRWPEDLGLIRRRFEALHEHGDLSGAAKFLIEAVARIPDSHLELSPLWDRLSRSSAHGRLRLPQIEAIAVPAMATGAKLLFEARTAKVDRGEVVERDILRKAVDVRPIFSPAWRQMLSAIWSNDASSASQKLNASTQLADLAAKAGDSALADELRAQSLLNQDKPEPAALGFAQAVRDGAHSAELHLSFATALHLIHDEAAARALLNRLIDQRPLCQEAYLALYDIAEADDQPGQAGRVLGTWLATDPDSTFARRLEAREAYAQHRLVDARKVLMDLLEHHDSDPDVLGAVVDFFSQTAHAPDLAQILEKRFTSEPWNFQLGQTLALLYQQLQKPADATRVADAVRAGIASDPDLLYVLSGLYSKLGADEQSEQVLGEILKLDASFPGANNDLGYLWIEHGRNAAQAEDLIRKAVAAEPDNPSFLDSLGWVLYKRGKFSEALQNLTRAADPAEQADPVVLDHLGDTFYRLGKRDQANQNWQQAAKRIAATREEGRDDLKELRNALTQKQQDAGAGRPVMVAPVLAGSDPSVHP